MNPHRILVCEDDPLLAMDMAARIEAMGHVVLGPVGNAADALDLADAGGVDASVVDLNLLDGRSGLALARELQGRGVPVAICSGGELAPTELRDMRHVFVRKPLAPHVLETCVDGVLQRADVRAVA